MSKRFEIPMFKPRRRPKFKREGSNVVVYYKDDLSSVRQAIVEQWAEAPLTEKVALDAEFRLTPPKRVSKAVREAMLAGKVAPSCAANTLQGLLRGAMDALAGVVVQDERDVVLITGRMCYAEIAGATLRVGEAQFLAM